MYLGNILGIIPRANAEDLFFFLSSTMSGFWKWGFRASVDCITSEPSASPVITDSVNFYDFVHTKLKTIDTKSKLWLNPLLFNGSLQTLYYAMHNSDQFSVYYGRELFQYNDGGQCSLDWVIPEPSSKEEFTKLYKETLPDNSPRLHPRTRFFTSKELENKTAHGQTPESTDPICVVLHGLAGGSHEPLIRNLGQCLQQSPSNWDIVVVNSRGCCRTKITTGKLFNALSTSDLEDVLIELKKRYPSRPIYAVGFSFGAVLLANYLGEAEEKAKSMLKASVLIGCPWDMSAAAHHIDSSLTGRYLFNPSLTQFLNKLVRANLKELRSHVPELFSEETVEKAKMAKKTYQWDDLITCKTANFDNAWDYYDAGSPIRRIDKIKVPTLIINSTDDPAVDPALPREEVKANPNLALVETNLGGHLGFVKYSGEFWCVEVAEDFCDQFHVLTTHG
ncbi:putative medium-chain fatty acid ethyl ester synthase esterase [Clavispora lusitaniae]|uniref:Medium-chain fatty acid ethyl ester synthase esterase n=1 Tax=Clavispora lusitaniae TaxID=36911 RepID=A0ACD0WIL4_CLALS|nr:putative medium-chain fatty acid ethyl ester synthase esterase [Clavispora lusitaniae]QFZ33577.1 putative medium-chain fatty acid ethyl ester synthase esterase [Clavispora lusitaniae]QFZ39248.1 putative medium-chain fatty acid ethyl ester synthase esterase [Clavispora lusitaniae]QFZ44930.1 putative medium-chain fatty acid ethyl ester synthase esterase [Clavispora lusitaniae]QFZ50607.1 putative medium-chain fatty acid ethyl ester synthase esterase [Clavispora lusitaniae]